MNGYKMQKFLSFDDSPEKEKVEIPTEYSAYLEKCWDEARKRQMRAEAEVRNKLIVFYTR